MPDMLNHPRCAIEFRGTVEYNAEPGFYCCDEKLLLPKAVLSTRVNYYGGLNPANRGGRIYLGHSTQAAI